MKTGKFKIVILIALILCGTALYPQTNAERAQSLLNDINISLSQGECDRAERQYSAWRSLTSRTDAEIERRIKECRIIPVSGISLNRRSATLVVGSSETITATISPDNATNRNVSWSSNNSSVATVNPSGRITAIGAGDAVITARTEDGGRTATINVRVNPATIPVSSISLSRNSTTLTVGSSENIVATILPSNATNRNVSWRSSNNNVATVDSWGNVRAVNVGDAVIIATTTDGNREARVNVRVNSATISVSGISLDPSSTTLTVGSSENIVATVLPPNATNRNVSWSSNNPSVATVDAWGNIRTVSEGNTTITARTEDGGRTATVSVRVNPATIPVALISLAISTNAPMSSVTTISNTWSVGTSGSFSATSHSGATITVGNSETITATIYPANATNRNVSWNSSNPAVATVNSSGRVTAVSAGDAVITARVENREQSISIRVNPSATNIPTATHGVVINGIRWATRNLESPERFAPAPESLGMFYQWNRDRRGFPARGSTVSGMRNSASSGTFWTNSNDPCPPGWRVPNQWEFQSLLNSGYVWTTRHGVSGKLFGTAPNQIFLPAVGRRAGGHSNGRLDHAGTQGNYWSSTGVAGGNNAQALWFHSNGARIQSTSRVQGMSIRCVAR